MSDRELLELAAKAAGINAANWREGHGFCPPELHEHHKFYWNPLTDDGDALRLADRLRMDISWREDVIHGGFAQVKVSHDCGHVIEWLDRNESSLIATRRAIVRAAAELRRAI